MHKCIRHGNKHFKALPVFVLLCFVSLVVMFIVRGNNMHGAVDGAPDVIDMHMDNLGSSDKSKAYMNRKSEAEANTNREPEPEAITNREPESEANTNPEQTEAEANTNLKPEAVANTDREQTEAEANTNRKPEANTNREHESEANTNRKPEAEANTNREHEEEANTNREPERTYLVTWYTMVPYFEKKGAARMSDFSTCRYSNCRITLDQNYASVSDAVIFKGRHMPHKLSFKRPRGQIWIFAENEAPPRIHVQSDMPNRQGSEYMYGVHKWIGEFNWTMYYDKGLADIHLPYGEIRKHKTYIDRDYDKITAAKTKGALIITSDCDPPSKRMEFINELKNYTEVKVLGRCGKKWECGTKTYHDDCFDILNGTYSFYLAFENAFCQQYFTEKLFDNFNYDTLFITRGGRDHEAGVTFPKGSVINADEFKSVEELGTYMNMLRNDRKKYAQRLALKSQHYSPAYSEIYQQTLCDLCERLNHQGNHHQNIPNILKHLSPKDSCLPVD